MTRKGGRLKKRYWILLGLICFGLINLMALWLIHNAVVGRSRGRIYNVKSAPIRQAAVVFGAFVFKNGRISNALKRRLQAALDLYRAGKVKKIMVSGDNRRPHNHETKGMTAHLLKEGVPAKDIISDEAGYRTYETCYRARNIWNLSAPILVSDHYHLPRAIYLADNLGMKAIGVYCDPPTRRSRTPFREILARYRAWLDVNFLE